MLITSVRSKVISISSILLLLILKPKLTSSILVNVETNQQLNDLSSLYNTQNHQEPGAQCRYMSCPRFDQSKVNVHIIAHTHDDVGWLKTVDQYYYGTKKRLNTVGVSYILDSLIPQLVMDKSKRFVYVEVAFFSRWWNEQNEPMKNIVRQLVDEGRLEFINGGWCMNDEATTSYQSTIEQMTLGLKFLNETFGACGRPKVGWQIDPFGHSNEQASLFAQFGFDGMYFSRANYYDKLMRAKLKSLDLIWHGDIALGQSGSIFTNIFRDTYESVDGFCFDATCLDDSIVDNPKSYEYNLVKKSLDYIDFIRTYAKQKLTNHVLIPFGGDFQFSAADQNFKNMDKLIAYISKHAPDLNLFYSTPTCYQLAVHNSGIERKIKWPEKYDDFMPYESNPTVWWSGYFSSRQAVKLIERQTSSLLQSVRLAQVKPSLNTNLNNNRLKENEESCVMPLWQALGDLQHHDAITGTEKQHVADDYVRRAVAASNECASFMGNMRRNYIDSSINKTSPIFLKLKENVKPFSIDPLYVEKTELCPLLNISQCDPLDSKILSLDQLTVLKNELHLQSRLANISKPVISDDDEIILQRLKTRSVLMTVYNSLSRVILQHDFRIPCNEPCDLDKVRIIHVASNETLKIIRLPAPAGVISLPFRESNSNYEILFYADLPALSYTTFLIEDENEKQPTTTNSNSETTQKPSVEENRSSRDTRELQINSQLSGGNNKYEYFFINDGLFENKQQEPKMRLSKRDAWDNEAERVVVKFDMGTGMIVGLRRVSDGTYLNVTQKFGFYYPDFAPAPGAYTFRPNSTKPVMFEKPEEYKIFRRKNGRLIEIQQKWADWIWQTIRVDSRKSYIEFDYVIGPVPVTEDKSSNSKLSIGKEIITRYESNFENNNVFFTDSNSRQLSTRKVDVITEPAEVGGAFYPVTSTIALRNLDKLSANKSADFLAILTDRAQAGTSIKPGSLELLIHRRLLMDDHWGVDEALNEPGEDGRGLVVRGKHRMYLKFSEEPPASTSTTQSINNHQEQKNSSSILHNSATTINSNVADNKKPLIFELPRTASENLTYARQLFERNSTRQSIVLSDKSKVSPTFIVRDPVIDNLRIEATKFAFQPVITFDSLRASANEFMSLLSPTSLKLFQHSLLNSTPPTNIHLLTFMPWTQANTFLIRVENLDNPITVHPLPHAASYQHMVRAYNKTSASISSFGEYCQLRVELELEHMFAGVQVHKLDELTLGANMFAKDDKRLDWTTTSGNDKQASPTIDICKPIRRQTKPTLITLGPRQIRTFIAHYESRT